MTRITLVIVTSLLLLIVLSGFTYWTSNQTHNQVFTYIEQVDLSLYTHRGVQHLQPEAKEKKQTIEEKIAAIDKRFEAGDKLGALARYNQLLEADPNNMELLLRTGIIYLQEKEYALAEENLSTVYQDKASAFALDAAWFLALLKAQYQKEAETKALLKEVIDGRGNYYLNATEYQKLLG